MLCCSRVYSHLIHSLFQPPRDRKEPKIYVRVKRSTDLRFCLFEIIAIPSQYGTRTRKNNAVSKQANAYWIQVVCFLRNNKMLADNCNRILDASCLLLAPPR